MQSFTHTWKGFVKVITFINLPIKKKFLLFGLGTFFWFVIIGAVSVSVLTFIHYRYSQITNTTIPYNQAIQIISSKLDNIELLAKWGRDEKNQEKHLFQATLQLRQIQSAISATTIHVNGNQNNNIFETITYTLSKDDFLGQQSLQKLLDKVRIMDHIISIAYEKSASSQDYKLVNIWDDLDKNLIESKIILDGFSSRTSSQLKEYSIEMNKTIKYAINTIAIVFFIATSLLLFFTKWLTEAFSKPIKSMIHQIHSIGTGEVDLNKKLKIKSKDEIGTLSKEFNKLVDTVYGVTVFKQVIEEDSTLDIVYGRLAEVFEKEAKIDEYRIFDVNSAKETMSVIQPPLFGADSMMCHAEILNDCSLCRAQKTGHKISSLEYEGVCKQFKNENDKEHICIPLVVAGQTGAVVQFIFDKQKREEDLELINEKVFKAESYIKNSLSVIETKQLMHTLRESSLVDSLTGLYNRRFLQDHSNQIIAGVLRRKKQISLLMCDMDYFKQVNDEHGHDIGDSVLKETSHILKNSIRDSDVVIRFGGEEFLILLIDTEPGYGIQIAEKIRENIEKNKFKSSKGGVLQKTISIGVSEFPKDTDGFWQSIKFADVALYNAKEIGRNKSVRFTSALWEETGSF